MSKLDAQKTALINAVKQYNEQIVALSLAIRDIAIDNPSPSDTLKIRDILDRQWHLKNINEMEKKVPTLLDNVYTELTYFYEIHRDEMVGQ